MRFNSLQKYVAVYKAMFTDEEIKKHNLDLFIGELPKTGGCVDDWTIQVVKRIRRLCLARLNDLESMCLYLQEACVTNKNVEAILLQIKLTKATFAAEECYKLMQLVALLEHEIEQVFNSCLNSIEHGGALESRTDSPGIEVPASQDAGYRCDGGCP